MDEVKTLNCSKMAVMMTKHKNRYDIFVNALMRDWLTMYNELEDISQIIDRPGMYERIKIMLDLL